MAETEPDLAGEVAFVTGAGRGFGRAIALRLAAAGASVGLMARRAEDVAAVAGEITATGGKALAVPGDATVAEDVERAVDATEAAFGGLSALVNNAGVGWPYGPIAGMDAAAWWQAQALHQLAPMLLLSKVLPGMIARGRGRIVVVSSRAHGMLIPNFSPYAIGKLVQCRLVEMVDVENRASGISAFAIDPGFVFTDMAREGMANPDARKHIGFFVDMLEKQEREQDPATGLADCGERVATLLSGRYDGLSGRYLMPDTDLDAALATAGDGPGGRLAA